MTADIEAGGALVTAGLAASEIEAGKSAQGTHEHAAKCVNCGAALTGRYCHACGQAAHVHRSLLHIAEEALHGMLHFDTKSWRTLPLLIARPGLLTRRYIDGQRVRYVSPLASFLFTVFLMFFVVSLVNSTNFHVGQINNSDQARTELTASLAKAKAKVAKREAALNRSSDDEDRKEGAADLAKAKLAQSAAEQALSEFESAIAKGDESAVAAVAKVRDKQKNNFNLNIGTKGSPLRQTIEHNLENQELLLYKLKNTAYKFSFMLIPISLPFLWLMFFWKRDVRVYDHAVFALYSLSFMSLYFSLIALMTTKPYLEGYIGAMLFVPPVHMFAQLRGTYRLRIFSALWRTCALIFIAGTVFIMFMIFVITVSVT